MAVPGGVVSGLTPAAKALFVAAASNALPHGVVFYVVPGDVEYYDVPDDVIVATPALKGHRYVYLNDRVYLVDSGRRIVATVD